METSLETECLADNTDTDAQEGLAAAAHHLALAAERERIGRDLHDVVLQHLYGLGLSVQAIAGAADTATSARLEEIVDEIDGVITDIRTIVFTLGSATQRGTLGQELGDVVAQASRVLGFTPALRVEGPVESVLCDAVRIEMVAALREALGNVARHAGASRVEVSIGVRDDLIEVIVVDNGVGPPTAGANAVGNGLWTMCERARALGGDCSLVPTADGGAEFRWRVPY